MSDALDPRIVRMPPLDSGTWLNSRALSKEALRGQVVLIDFWDYTCINCLRTLPYLQAWHGRYANKGLTILGIHTPEFKFAKMHDQIERAIAHLDIPYPILLDDTYQLWHQFTTKAWPTKFLVDARGYIRLRRQGEGYYRDIEQAIQSLLKERDSEVALPDLLPPLREEDTPGAVCYRPTPEIYAGYQGGGLFAGGLGNGDGYMPQMAVLYDLPPREARLEGSFYVSGAWKAWPEAMAFAGKDVGEVRLPYTAVSVNAVLAPSADDVELALNLRPSMDDPVVEVLQDGRYLAQHLAGDDIAFDPETGASYVRIDRPRLYQLVRNLDYESHELILRFQATGLALYTFTFTSCIAPDIQPGTNGTFRMH